MRTALATRHIGSGSDRSGERVVIRPRDRGIAHPQPGKRYGRGVDGRVVFVAHQHRKGLRVFTCSGDRFLRDMWQGVHGLMPDSFRAVALMPLRVPLKALPVVDVEEIPPQSRLAPTRLK